MSAVLVLGGAARADCQCPAASLDEEIAGSVVIFAGKPLMSAQIPQGSSPFHSEQTLETPGGVKNDLVTLFQVETMWKGAQVHRIKVRNDQGVCSPQFKPDLPVIFMSGRLMTVFVSLVMTCELRFMTDSGISIVIAATVFSVGTAVKTDFTNVSTSLK